MSVWNRAWGRNVARFAWVWPVLTGIALSLAMVGTGCRSRRPIPAGEIWASGFHGVRWGQPPSAVDELVAADSHWVQLHRVSRFESKSSTIILRRDDRDYYLDFSPAQELMSINFISARKDLDSFLGQLSISYGEPDQLDSQQAYSQRQWIAGNDSVRLSVELLRTETMYSFTVTSLTHSRQP